MLAHIDSEWGPIDSGYDMDWDIDDPHKISHIANSLERKGITSLKEDDSIGLVGLELYYAFLVEVQYNEDPKNRFWRQSYYSFKFGLVLEKLRVKYQDKPSNTFEQIIEENKELNITGFNEWSQFLYGRTAEQFLFAEGLLLTPPQGRTNWLSYDEALDYINKCILKLYKKYCDEPAKSYNQLIEDNQDLDFKFLDSLVKRIYNESAKVFIRNKGYF